MASSHGNSPTVSIGVVTWNSETDLPSFLDGLDEQDYPETELIVVDNASADASVALIRERRPAVEVVLNARNEGFCHAQNQGILAARGEYYLALNPDTRLLPGFIERLVASLEAHPECGSAVGKLWQTAGQEPRLFDTTGLYVDRRRHQYLRGRGEPDRGQYDTAGEVFGADGAASLFRRTMLEDVKIFGEYFDEAFFIYMEDVDLAWRSRLFGWRTWYEPQAQAWHARGFSPGQRRQVPNFLRRHAVKNRYLTILKNESPEGWRRDWARILAYDLQILGYMLVFEQSSLGAFALLQEQWARGFEWRGEIWKRVKALPEERLEWFR